MARADKIGEFNDFKDLPFPIKTRVSSRIAAKYGSRSMRRMPGSRAFAVASPCCAR